MSSFDEELLTVLTGPGSSLRGLLDHALTLTEVSERYLNDPTSARTGQSEMTYRTTYATILGIVGADCACCLDHARMFGALSGHSANSRKPGVHSSVRAHSARRTVQRLAIRDG